MVEIQNININDLVKNDDGTFENEIVLSPYKQENSKNLASESEMHRILMHLNKKSEDDKPEKNTSGYDIVPSFFTLDVGKNIARYDKLIKDKGILKITNMEYVLDEEGNKILDKDNHYVTKKKDTKQYASTFCGAGHSRTQKNLFVDMEVVDKLNDILLCGMPKNLMHDTPSKWNAYYAMVTTDSTALSNAPKIVVIDDYKKSIKEKVDIVEVSGTGDNKKYKPIGHKGRKRCRELLEILPFDGAGLVTPECALKWAKELDCKSRKGKFYLPSCFQFRAIPGIKGEVMVFDLKRFAKEMHVSKIIDLGGREWDIFKDEIDVILTKSQFKFWKQYLDKDGNFDYTLWRNEFDKKCHGYNRTFNIVSYGVHPSDLASKTMLSYQPEQTINFTDEEIPVVSKTGIDIYRKIVSNVDEFLKYRALIDISDDGEEVENIDKYTPPYYVALSRNKELFHDKYVHGKIESDIEKLRNNLLAGKLFVHGNYQVFMPDLYGLAEWAFHDELGREPQGLLKEPYHIYSDWWNDRGAFDVDMIRNPHVGMEHRICHLRNNKELKKWYKFQSTGIVTGMYDALALVIGNADFDGDSVAVFDSKPFIDAVQREFKAGNGRLVVKVEPNKKEKTKKEICVADRAALMKVNQMSFKNSIGSVIDRVTDLWSCVHVDEQKVRDYIKIGVIVGGETIDFAKTGENAFFPKEIKNFFKSCKRGYWMRYLAKNSAEALAEEKALKKARNAGKSEQEIEKIRKFKDYDCNMNRLCHYAETEIAHIDLKTSEYDFDYRKCFLRSQPSINRKVYRMVQVLQREYREIAKWYNEEALKSKSHQRSAANKYRWFYEKCRTELLILEPDINKLIDMLVIIYYGDKKNGAKFLDLEKDILWNAFPDEMIVRSSGETIMANIDFSKLEENHKRNVEFAKKQKNKNANRKKVIINSIQGSTQYKDKSVLLTKEDRKCINNLINKAYEEKTIKRKDNVAKLKRILTMLVYLSRKYEDENGVPQWMKKLNNVPNELTDITLERLTDVSHKYMDSAIALFEKRGIVESVIYRGGTKIRVLFPYHEGETWIETEDYNKAGTMIRDYFRYDKGTSAILDLENELRENITKIS
ncbi:MAG: hypothetical protein IJN54_01890 [Lachnospiraceae bacterium]|nr:hypothetical protein [Lachnospiraceae bacterium]